jgi:NTP pyrophosphatase (non-canonical NTP hydrolase)
MNPFNDQSKFMLACGQTVGEPNNKQLALYMKLIDEEVGELAEAVECNDDVEVLDAITDILVVTIGAGLSRFTPEQLTAAWNEVFASNMSKLDPKTGKAVKREDGKVMKGPAYRKPDLEKIACPFYSLPPNKSRAKDRQVGGDHYKNMGVEPWDVVDTWPIEQRIGAYRHGALKYLMRMGTKDEQLQEIRKAAHYLQKLIEVLENDRS